VRKCNSFSACVVIETDCMGQNPSREVGSRSPGQEISRHLWNPDIYYRVVTGLPLVPNLTLMNPVKEPLVPLVQEAG